MLGCIPLGHPFFFQFFHSEIANPKCKKVFLYGENRHFRLGAFNLPLRFVRLLPKSSSPSALQADAFGELTPKKIGPFFPHQLIQKLSNFSSKSLKISQNPEKSWGFNHTKRRLSKTSTPSLRWTEPTRCCRWGSNQDPFNVVLCTLPLSHCGW